MSSIGSRISRRMCQNLGQHRPVGVRHRGGYGTEPPALVGFLHDQRFVPHKVADRAVVYVLCKRFFGRPAPRNYFGRSELQQIRRAASVTSPAKAAAFLIGQPERKTLRRLSHSALQNLAA